MVEVKLVRASGKAACRNCYKTIKKDSVCLAFYCSNNYGGAYKYVHLNCVDDGDGHKFVKVLVDAKLSGGLE